MNIGYDAKRIFHNTTGLGNYSRDLVRVLSTYFTENQYFLYNPKKKTTHRFTANNLNEFEVLPNTFFSKLFPSIWRSKWITKQLKKDGIDIFHGLTGELPMGINKTKIKSIVTIHDLIFMRYPELYKAIDRKIYLKKFQFAVQNADVVIAISQQTKRDIVSFLHIKPEKIKVLYQGCHAVFKETIPTDLEQATIVKYQLPEKFLLYVGSIIERKNVLSAIKAVEKTGDSLVIVGDGTSYFDVVKTYVIEKKLSQQIVFLNGLTMLELAVLYKRADIFIYPSTFEGFGIPIIEALYSKTPVITGEGSCFPEAGGPHTSYVNPQDIDAIVSEIKDIQINDIRRKEMIEKGFDYVQKFNEEVIAREMMQAYQEVLS